jgi:hypothetical protein
MPGKIYFLLVLLIIPFFGICSPGERAPIEVAPTVEQFNDPQVTIFLSANFPLLDSYKGQHGQMLTFFLQVSGVSGHKDLSYTLSITIRKILSAERAGVNPNHQ